MRRTLDRTARNMAAGFRSFKDEVAGEIPMDIGFPFSAWFFLGVVAFTFLDAYFTGGRGLGQFMDVPGQVLAHATKMGNV